MEFELKEEYIGPYVPRSDVGKVLHFNDYVITGPIAGNPPEWRRLGRIVQIRKDVGMYGGDVFLLRHADGSLWNHDNQCLFMTHPKYRVVFDKLFENGEIDVPGEEYAIDGKEPATGFVISAKKE